MKPDLDGHQRRTHAFGDGVTWNLEPTMRSGLRAEMREAEKIKRFWATIAAWLPVFDRIATEFDQSRFTFVELQAKLG